MTIEDYLAELRRQLPLGARRRRILAEVADHLHEAARELGEDEAVRRFGSVDDVAGKFAGSLACSLLRLASFTLGIALAFPVLTYPLVENGLPPAPWPSASAKPDHLAWKQDAVAALLLVALGAAASAASLWRRGSRSLLAPVLVGQTALTAAAVLGLVLSVQWAHAVPGTPWWLLALPVFMLGLVLASGALLGRALLLR